MAFPTETHNYRTHIHLNNTPNKSNNCHHNEYHKNKRSNSTHIKNTQSFKKIHTKEKPTTPQSKPLLNLSTKEHQTQLHHRRTLSYINRTHNNIHNRISTIKIPNKLLSYTIPPTGSTIYTTTTFKNHIQSKINKSMVIPNKNTPMAQKEQHKLETYIQ